jgi:hypothetical protein
MSGGWLQQLYFWTVLVQQDACTVPDGHRQAPLFCWPLVFGRKQKQMLLMADYDCPWHSLQVRGVGL